MPKLTKAARAAMADNQFAFPRTRDCPLHDPHHISMAWGQYEHVKNVSDDERAQAKLRILAVAKTFDMDIADEDGALPRVMCLDGMSMQAASLEVPDVPDHPNRMPFTGIMTRIDEPSDSPPSGSNGRRVMITMECAKRSLPSLLGMAVDYQADFAGHDPQKKIGVITEANIEANAIVVKGFLYSADFPEVCTEIKANKDDLGMSFEARDLWTNNPKADPIPILDCFFTGAAILLKNKAAYRSTSISAAAAAKKDSITMDDNTKKEMGDLLSAALKPVNEAIAKTAADLDALKQAGVQAKSALVDKVEPHAARLDDAADKMERDGIGGHPSRGHANVLRDMAGKMRADAAVGKMPHVYDGFSVYGNSAAQADVNVAVEKAVNALKEEQTKAIETMKAGAEQAAKTAADEIASRDTKIKDLEAQVTKLKSDVAASTAPKRKTLTPQSAQLLAKTGIGLPEGDSKLQVAVLDKAMAEAGLDLDERFTLKAALRSVGSLA